MRSGLVTSITDDEWHVDGFSMRVPQVPEQNYIWSDVYPTEQLWQRFKIPQTFDPKRHTPYQMGMKSQDVCSTFPSAPTAVDGIRFSEGLEKIGAVIRVLRPTFTPIQFGFVLLQLALLFGQVWVQTIYTLAVTTVRVLVGAVEHIVLSIVQIQLLPGICIFSSSLTPALL